MNELSAPAIVRRMTSCDTCGQERVLGGPPCPSPECVAERAEIRQHDQAARRHRRRVARRRGYPIVRLGAWRYHLAEGWGIRRGRVPIAAVGPRFEEVAALRLSPAPRNVPPTAAPSPRLSDLEAEEARERGASKRVAKLARRVDHLNPDCATRGRILWLCSWRAVRVGAFHLPRHYLRAAMVALVQRTSPELHSGYNYPPAERYEFLRGRKRPGEVLTLPAPRLAVESPPAGAAPPAPDHSGGGAGDVPPAHPCPRCGKDRGGELRLPRGEAPPQPPREARQPACPGCGKPAPKLARSVLAQELRELLPEGTPKQVRTRAELVARRLDGYCGACAAEGIS